MLLVAKLFANIPMIKLFLVSVNKKSDIFVTPTKPVYRRYSVEYRG